MGTRSRIAVMHGNNAKSIYCHWDGYLEHNGFILQSFYDSVKANELVSLGDLSSLGANIGEKHDFDERLDVDEYKDTRCTFYGRDRGETGTEFKTDTTFDSFIERVEGCCAEWYYVMRDGVWYVGNVYSSDERFYKQLVPLAEALASVEVTV